MNAKEMLKYWSIVREDLFQALDQVSDEELHFRPREGLWSLGEVARHIAGAEDGWFGHVVWQQYADWPPESNHAETPTVDSVRALLTEVHERTVSYLEPLSDQDLETIIKAPWGNEFPLRWVVWHVLEHEVHHRGEIFLMLGLLGREAPDV